MSSKAKTKAVRPGGEFYRPVVREQARQLPGEEAGELVDFELDAVRLELNGEAYRADIPTQVKRDLFLIEVEKLENEATEIFGVGALGSLKQDVLPLYIAHGSLSYQASLDAWLKRWRIDAPWVRDVALTTLQEWSEAWAEPGYYRGRDLEWQLRLGESVLPSRASRIVLDYDPLTMNRAEVEAQLKHVLDTRDAQVRSVGAVRTRETRQSRQFTWLARARVLNQNEDAILRADEDRDLMDNSVNKSCQRLAAEIGLP